MEYLDKWLNNINKCSFASKTLYEQLKYIPELNQRVIFDEHKGGFCFHIKLIIPNGIIYGLSISYPPDCNNNGHKNTIEIVLRDINSNICSICRFENISQIINEIHRLTQYNNDFEP